MFSPCSTKIRASDKDLPVPHTSWICDSNSLIMAPIIMSHTKKYVNFNFSVDFEGLVITGHSNSRLEFLALLGRMGLVDSIKKVFA